MEYQTGIHYTTPPILHPRLMFPRKFSNPSSLDIAMLKAVSGDKAALKQLQSIKRGFSRMGGSNLYPQWLH
jgi:hypothetical protein